MHFVSVAPHNPWSWVNTVASLHLDAVIPNFLIQEVITEPEPWKDAIVVNPPVMDAEGYLRRRRTATGTGHHARPRGREAFPPVEGGRRRSGTTTARWRIGKAWIG